jgi:hypothetical protein
MKLFAREVMPRFGVNGFELAVPVPSLVRSGS